jgi:hypothetical protein
MFTFPISALESNYSYVKIDVIYFFCTSDLKITIFNHDSALEILKVAISGFGTSDSEISANFSI